MTKLYRPGNGTEGCEFIENWCDGCEKERPFREEPEAGNGCDILLNTMVLEVTNPDYPQEWRYMDGRPVCTAFERERIGGPDAVAVTSRCSMTKDMFS